VGCICLPFSFDISEFSSIFITTIERGVLRCGTERSEPRSNPNYLIQIMLAEGIYSFQSTILRRGGFFIAKQCAAHPHLCQR
jgi:hypothetical protein